MGYIGSGISRFNTADELTVTGDAVIDTTTLVVDSTNNRVGVLTASPATALDVAGTVTADGLTVDGVTSSFDTTPAISGLQLHFETDTGLGSIGSYVSGGAGLGFYTNTGTDPLKQRIKISGGGDISFYADDGTTQALFFDASTQRLGLGTTAPDALLQIEKSDSGTTINKEPSQQSGPNIAIHNSNQTANNLSSIQFTNRGTNGVAETATAGIHVKHEAQGGTYSYGSMNFNTTNSAGSYATRMHISAFGQVGIGTAAPGGSLEVYKAGTSEILIGTDNGGTAQLSLYENDDGTKEGLLKYDGTNNRIHLATSGAANALVIPRDSGNVGIGESAPEQKLHISGTFLLNNNQEIRFKDSGGSQRTAIAMSSNDLNIGTSAGGNLKFYNGSSYTERMRLDASGNLLLGGTNTFPAGNNVVGTAIRPGGDISITKAGDFAIFANRKDSDGGIIDFRKDGTSVGVIGVMNGNNPYIANDADNSGLQFGSGSITPAYDGAGQDNSVDLGSSSTRFKIGYFNDSVRTRYFVGVDDSNTYIEMGGSDNIKVFNGGSEKFRFGSDGAFSVGVTSTSAPGSGNTQAGITLRGAIGDAFFSRADGDAGYFNRNNDGSVVTFSRSGTAVGNVAVTTSNTAFNTSSDRRLKSNIQDAASASDKIDAIQVRQFDWNVDDSHQDYGLIAQELQPIEPMAVTGDADSDEMMGVDYSKLVPMLIKEIQELRSRVAALEAN